MMMQNGIKNILEENSKIPVVTFHQLDEVGPVMAKLIAQSIHCIEITLRTEAAVDAIQKCQSIAPPEFSVGVGTVVDAKQVKLCQDLGVDFMVSPGSAASLVDSMFASGIPFLPGVMTPSEIIAAAANNCHFLKLFPFNLAGGMKAIKTYGNVFPSIKFCPTGGVGADNYQALLQLKNVVCVGGSWLVK